MSLYKRYASLANKSPTYLRHHNQRLSITKSEADVFTKSCIEAAKVGNFNVFFDSQLKPVKSIENVRDKENDGNSILHVSCLNKQLHLVEALLSISDLFDVNIQNNEGNTPLHLIIIKDSSYIPIIHCLIKNYNASPYIRNKLGETPQFLLSFSQFGLNRIPELNLLLSMHTFRQKKERDAVRTSNNATTIRGTVKQKISRMTPESKLVYKQIYRKLANGSTWLRREHLFKIFDTLNMPLFEQELKKILSTIDFNHDGHVDFEDFLAFLLMPIHDWTHIVINKNETNKQPEKQKQFKDSIYLNPLIKTGVIKETNQNENENENASNHDGNAIAIKIKKDDYLHLNELLGDIFSCTKEEIKFTFKEITRFANKEDEIDDPELQQTSEELQKGYLDEEVWTKIVNDDIVIKHKVPKKREQTNQSREQQNEP